MALTSWGVLLGLLVVWMYSLRAVPSASDGQISIVAPQSTPGSR
jgi:hypothetical protein